MGRFSLASLSAAALAVSAALAPAPTASAASPFLVVPDPAVAEQTPAYRYANMTDAEAFAELDRRRIIYTRLGEVPGVRAPIRLTGRLHGVWFHSSLPPDERVTSPFEILDARLALALDDFAAVLERHDIDEVVHFTMYRPNVTTDGPHARDEQRDEPRSSRKATRQRDRRGAAKTFPNEDALKKHRGPSPAKQKPRTLPKTGETIGAPPSKNTAKPSVGNAARKEAARKDALAASKSAPRARPAPPGTRHPAGLAIDVGGLRKKDGRWLSVGHHFDGRRGERTCGEGARIPERPEARELRSIVCEAFDLGLFTYVLTPNYDAAHADHFHMEIKGGVHWFLVH